MGKQVWSMPDETITRFNDGELIADLAKEYGVSPETVRRKLRAKGIDTRKKPFVPGRHAKNAGIPRKHLPDEIITRYKREGVSIRLLSQQYSVDYNTVRRHLVYAGVPIRGPGRPRKHFDEIKESA